LLIFVSDITFNKVFAFISILFIKDVSVCYNGRQEVVVGPGLFEDIIDFDTSSSTIYQSYLSTILTFFNNIPSSSDNGSSATIGDTTKSKAKVGTSQSSTSLFSKPGESGFASSKRSYTSISGAKNIVRGRYVLELSVKNSKNVFIHFESLEDLNDFLVNYRR